MTVTECIKRVEELGGSFEVVDADRVRATLPEDAPPEIIPFLNANKEAVKAAILHPPTITIEPIRKILPPDDGQYRMMKMIRAAMDDGVISLTGKIKYYQRTGLIEIDYIPHVQNLDWGRYWGEQQA